MNSLVKILVVIAALAAVSDCKPPKRYGGNYARSNPFPYIVSLIINGRHACGGTIVDTYWILTSASCLAGKVVKPYHNLVIIAGSSSLRYKSAYHADVILVTVEFQPNNATSSNDLALIKLREAIRYSYYASKIIISRSPPVTGLAAYTPGWGRLVAHFGGNFEEMTPILMQTIKSTECQDYTSRTITPDQICGYGETRNKGVCAGDNGNPFVYNNQVIGVATGMVACGNAESDVFTSVYYYYDWITGYISGRQPLPIFN